jgi:NADPH:quinone reductase-like Zn-dependent oxidoreductase
MKAVVIETFGATDVLQVRTDVPAPEIGPDELLVRVHATSVNPIDCAVRSGYGAKFFLDRGLIRLPLTPGRDVAGVVEKVGAGVSGFAPGDRVYAGVTNFATAELIAVPAAWAAPMPRTLSFVEAAAIPYAALTAWSALVDMAGLTEANTPGKRIVIPRGAGGVGSFAIQLMKAWGAHVATICSTRNVELVRSLGADVVVDYLHEDFAALLSGYDVAFDTAFDTEAKLLGTLKTGADAAYVSIVTPKLHLIDEFGLEEGLRRGEAYLVERKAEQAALGRRYDWSFMEPNGAALRMIGALIEAGRVRPVVDRVYTIDEIAAAQDYCETKQARGKIVVAVSP